MNKNYTNCCDCGENCPDRKVKKTTSGEVKNLKEQIDRNNTNILRSALKHPEQLGKMSATDIDKLCGE